MAITVPSSSPTRRPGTISRPGQVARFRPPPRRTPGRSHRRRCGCDPGGRLGRCSPDLRRTRTTAAMIADRLGTRAIDHRVCARSRTRSRRDGAVLADDASSSRPCRRRLTTRAPDHVEGIDGRRRDAGRCSDLPGDEILRREPRTRWSSRTASPTRSSSVGGWAPPRRWVGRRSPHFGCITRWPRRSVGNRTLQSWR